MNAILKLKTHLSIHTFACAIFNIFLSIASDRVKMNNMKIFSFPAFKAKPTHTHTTIFMNGFKYFKQINHFADNVCLYVVDVSCSIFYRLCMFVHMSECLIGSINYTKHLQSAIVLINFILFLPSRSTHVLNVLCFLSFNNRITHWPFRYQHSFIFILFSYFFRHDNNHLHLFHLIFVQLL